MSTKKHTESGNFILMTCQAFFKAAARIIAIILLWTLRISGNILLKISEFLEHHILK